MTHFWNSSVAGFLLQRQGRRYIGAVDIAHH